MPLPRLHRTVCEAGEYPHNHSCHWTTGIQCEDCGTWISNRDDFWFETNRFGNRVLRKDIRYGMSPRGPVPPPPVSDPLVAMVVDYWLSRPKP